MRHPARATIAAAIVAVLLIIVAAAVVARDQRPGRSSVADAYVPTPKETKIHEGLYVLLDRVAAALRANNIPYWGIGGTMLGAARHKGIIPWDDDLDIGVWDKDLGVAKEAILRELDGEARWVRSLRCYTVTVVGDPTAALDVFPMERRALGSGKEVIHFANALARAKWPKEYITPAEFGRWTTRVAFGPTTIPLIENPCPFLDRAFPDWDRIGIVKRHSALMGNTVPDGTLVRFDYLKSRQVCQKQAPRAY